MKKHVSMVTYIGVGFALATIASVALSQDNLIENITSPDQMKEVISSDNNVSIVKFYAPWCGYCKRMAEPYKMMAQKSSAKFAEINCDTPKGQVLAKEYGIDGFPMFLFFQNGKKIDIVEGADEKALQEKIDTYTRKGSNQKPSKKKLVKEIKTNAELDETLKNNRVTVVKFFAPWCGHCKRIADRYAQFSQKDHTAFVEVNCATQEGRMIAQKYKVGGFPTFMILNGPTVIGTVVGAHPKFEEMITLHIQKIK